MSLYKNILYAADLTEESFNMAKKAKKLAEQNKAQLNVIHAIESLPAFVYGYVSIGDIEEEIKKEANERLNKLAEQVNIPIKHRHLVQDSAKVAILRVAEEINADLIVVGSHARHGLFALGSTASAIAHRASSDVWVIRQKDEF